MFGWWFQTFFIFHFIYGLSSFPLTFICFKMAETTNQIIYIYIWVNHNDLTATSLEIMVYFREFIPKWPNYSG